MTKAKTTKPASPATAPKESKRDNVVQLLRRAGGASLTEITEATGWLPHSARAVLTGLRKTGLTIGKEKIDGANRYSIAPDPAA